FQAPAHVSGKLHSCVIPPAAAGRENPYRTKNISCTLCCMQDHRDDSIWKTLAVAFGDGLAFGAGMNLSRNAAARIRAGHPAGPAGGQEDIRILRAEMTGLHRQFAESVARLVDEQIAKTLEARLDPMEKQLKEEIRQQTGRAVSLVASATGDYVQERIAPLQTEAAELRQRIEASDRNSLEMVLALGQLCVAAAERL